MLGHLAFLWQWFRLDAPRLGVTTEPPPWLPEIEAVDREIETRWEAYIGSRLGEIDAWLAASRAADPRRAATTDR